MSKNLRLFLRVQILLFSKQTFQKRKDQTPKTDLRHKKKCFIFCILKNKTQKYLHGFSYYFRRFQHFPYIQKGLIKGCNNR